MDTWGSGFGQGGSPVNREPRSNRQPASDSVVPGGGRPGYVFLAGSRVIPRGSGFGGDFV